MPGWMGDDCKDPKTPPEFDSQCPDNVGIEGCLNGGTCFKKACCCRSGYIGDYCEIDRTACISDPCKNGGNCTGTAKTFKCECPKGKSYIII